MKRKTINTDASTMQTRAKRSPTSIYTVSVFMNGTVCVRAASVERGVFESIRPQGSIKPLIPVFADLTSALLFSTDLNMVIEKC